MDLPQVFEVGRAIFVVMKYVVAESMLGFRYNMVYHGKAKEQSSYAPSQWQTSLAYNDVSHWQGAYLDWSLRS